MGAIKFANEKDNHQISHSHFKAHIILLFMKTHKKDHPQAESTASKLLSLISEG